MESDLYDILQVAPHAEPEVIESAYKRLARKYHPDVNRAADAHEHMRALNHAYEILSNPTERAHYDTTRELNHFRRRPARRTPPKSKKRAAKKPSAARNTKWTPPAQRKKETVQEAVAVSETLIADASKLARTHSTITSEVLQKQLNIKYPRAVNLFATLLERGIIDDYGNWVLQTA